MALVAIVFAAARCGDDGESASGAAAGAGTGATGGSATVSSGTGGGPPACGFAKGIQTAGDAIPGQVVTVSIEGGAGSGYDVAWSVTKGALSAATGLTAMWTLPADVAVHVAETLSVTAVVSVAGCDDQTLSAEVVVDWPDALRTIVLYNPSVAGSDGVASYYAGARKIPDDHLCAVASTDATVLAGADYDAWLGTVLGCIGAVGPHVHYIAPVWGVPYKVSDRIKDIGTLAVTTVSLDALLVYGAGSAGLTQAPYNPIYQDGDSLNGVYDPYVPFGTLKADLSNDYYLVARLDGADADAAKALVDRAIAAQTLADAGTLAGTVYVDGNKGLPHPATDDFGSYEGGEWNIIGVETVFKARGLYDVVANYDGAEFGTAPAPARCPDALYYAGWYSFGNYNDVFAWKSGAIGGHLDSCSACDIRSGPDWSARALATGITATFGAVNEPYVAGMPEYDQFFEYLLEGASYGEAAYEATVIGGWMMVWVGDPLYRPYPTKPR